MWFKVDDKFHSHSKVRKALADDPASLALWVVAGSWSSDNSEDGFVPDHQLPWLIPAGADVLAQKLVAARLWRRVRGGYQFHDFGDWNPLADKVKAVREKRSEAGRKGGRRSAESRASKANKRKVHVNEDTTSERSNSDDLDTVNGATTTSETDIDSTTSENTEANAEANASANGQANAKQKRTPTRPDPKEPKTSLLPGGNWEADFEILWATAPQKRGNKKPAKEKYLTALKSGATPELILATMKRYAHERRGKDAQYTQRVSTWLHQRPWENGDDERSNEPAALWPWER